MSNERTNEELLQEIEEVKRENELLRKKLQEEFDSLGNSFKELEESEKKYRKLFEGTLDVIYQTDINGNITEISPSIEKYSGYTRQELIGTNVIKTYYDPEDRKEFLRQLLTNGKVVDYELRLKSKSNQLIYTASTSHIVYSEAGKPIAIEGVLRDITHRKGIELEIAKHHQELELIRETTKIANSRLDINFVLDYILKSTTQTVNASVGMIFLKDADTGNLMWGASLGLSNNFKNSFNKTQIKFGEGLTGIIAQTVEPIYIQENSSNDPRVVRSVVQEEGFNSFIGVPILADNEVIGVMNVLTRPPDILTEHDIFVCQTIGSQVGFAIRNAQLFSRQKEVEEYLLESESQFRSLFDNAADAIFIADAESGIIVNANKTVEKLMKLPIEQIIGMHQKDLHPPKMESHSTNTFNKQKIELEDIHLATPVENNVLCSDGSEIPVEVLASKVLYKGKECIMGIFRDITERKQAEDRLRASEEKLRAIFETANIGISIIDTTGKIQMVNSWWSDLLGIPLEEITSKTFLDLTYPDDIEISKEYFNKIINGEIDQHRLEKRFKNSSGNIVWVDVYAVKIMNREGKIENVVGMAIDITHRKQIEKELVEAKDIAELNSANVTAIIENTTNSIWAFNKDYKITYINHIFKNDFFNAFGVKLEAGSDLLNSLPSVITSLWKTRYDKVLNNERISFEDAVETGFGTVYVEVSMHPIIKNGEVVGGSCFASDITERKNAEKEQKYQYMLQSILMNIASHYINIPLEKVDDTINRSLKELGQFAMADRVYIFDYDWENDECHNTYEWCNDNIQPEIDNLQNVPLSMMTWWVEAHKKGEMLYIPDVFALSEDDGVRILLEPQGVKSLLTIPLIANEDCIGFVGFDSVNSKQNYTDSEQKLLTVFAQMLVNIKMRTLLEQNLIAAKEKAEENEYKVRSMFNNSLVGYLYSSPSGYVLEANQAALDIFGSPSLELTKQISLLTLPALVDVGFSQNLQKCLDENIIIADENLYTSKWGRTTYLKYYLIPISINDIIIGVWINLHDITDLWNIQQELIIAKVKAEESDRLKTAFLQNMSHEIRTPLNGIIGFTTLLSDSDLSQEEMKEITAVIKHSGNRLIEMVNNVLDISKIETGQVEVYRMTFPVESLLDDLYSFFSSLTESKGLKLICEAKNGNLRIDSDYQKLYQILSNLINNAVKFTSTGSIEMGYNLKETLIEFYVKDTGVGIAENIQQRIFERFMQADTSISRNYEGAGIGLSICKGLVEILGGKIWVESKFGQGSTFYFTIPLNCENLS